MTKKELIEKLEKFNDTDVIFIAINAEYKAKHCAMIIRDYTKEISDTVLNIFHEDKVKTGEKDSWF